VKNALEHQRCRKLKRTKEARGQVLTRQGNLDGGGLGIWEAGRERNPEPTDAPPRGSRRKVKIKKKSKGTGVEARGFQLPRASLWDQKSGEWSILRKDGRRGTWGQSLWRTEGGTAKGSKKEEDRPTTKLESIKRPGSSTTLLLYVAPLVRAHPFPPLSQLVKGGRAQRTRGRHQFLHWGGLQTATSDWKRTHVWGRLFSAVESRR